MPACQNASVVVRNWSYPGNPTPACPKAKIRGRFSVPTYSISLSSRSRERWNCSNSGRRRSPAVAPGPGSVLRFGVRQDQHGRCVNGMSRQIGQRRERRAPGGSSLVPLQLGAHPLGFDLGRIAAQRRSSLDPRPDGGEPGLEIAHQRLVLGDPLLEQERGVERRVDVGAELVEGDVDPRLRFGVTRPLPAPAGAKRPRRRAAARCRASSASDPWAGRGWPGPVSSDLGSVTSL